MGQEPQVGTAFDDAPGLDHEDLAGRADCRQPVGDDDRGATGERLGQLLVDGGLRRRVEVRGPLVQHGRASSSPANRQPLALATREATATFTDHGVQHVGQAAHDLVLILT